MTDADIESERLAFERFHAMRKHNSSRAERQEAWAVTYAILQRRQARAARAHPISPNYRWSEFHINREGEWTHPYKRTLEDAEVDEMFPGALAAFATQCDDIKASRFVCDSGMKLRLSVPMRVGRDTPHASVIWLPEMGIWRRYCTHVSCKPYEVVS